MVTRKCSSGSSHARTICLSFLIGSSPLLEARAAEGSDWMTINPAEMEAAVAAQNKHQEILIGRPGVQGIGVGLTEDGTHVGVHIFVKRGMVGPALPVQMEGVPARVIETDGFVAHDGPCADTPCHSGVFPRPVPMGVSTSAFSDFSAGTLGFRVHRIGIVDEAGYLTNNHVAARTPNARCPIQVNPAVVPGFELKQCQPGNLDANTDRCTAQRRIGELVQAVPIVMGESFLNTVDAAFVRSRRGCVSKRILDIGVPGAVAGFPALNDVVKMSGRTSGLKTNRVTTINGTVLVGYGSCGSALFVNQVFTEPLDSDSASLPGDSGAPVVRRLGTAWLPVGLNFAGDGFFGIVNPLPLVLNALGVRIDAAPDVPPARYCD